MQDRKQSQNVFFYFLKLMLISREFYIFYIYYICSILIHIALECISNNIQNRMFLKITFRTFSLLKMNALLRIFILIIFLIDHI